MKKILLPVLFLLPVWLTVAAQSTNQNIEFKSLLFDEFTDGTVRLKSGQTEMAPLNYNMEDQNVVFIKEEHYLTIADLASVDTVYIKERKFVTDGKRFYEIVSGSSSIAIYVTYSCKPHPQTGTVENTGAVTKTTNEISNTMSDVYTGRTFKRKYFMDIIPHYWIRPDSNVFYKAGSERQFMRAVPAERTSAVRDFIQTKNIRFDNMNDMLELAKFCNQK